MSHPTQDFAGRPPWTRPGFVVAVALLALVLVAGLVVGLAIVLRPDDPAPPVGVGPTATAATPDNTSTDEPRQTTPPTSAPDDVTWELVGQTAVPVSASAGPRTSDGGVASGYAHTPVGALVAAAQIVVRSGFSAGRASWEPTIQQQFEPSPDRDRLLATLRELGDPPAQPGELSQIVGYQYQSYSPDTAVIGLVLRAPSAGTPRYHVLSLTLRWREGDWRMVAPPGGAWTAINRETSDLVGVVEWGAR
ncbi:hypothetical protein AB0B88_20960 [Micromonospora haikouensis]|uniref:hypothetical protein n=1 Tax=Micromonospora haikouensis TaxID=686309 RepID=UPI0033FC2F9F